MNRSLFNLGILVILIHAGPLLSATTDPMPEVQSTDRAQQLKDFIQKEKPQFEIRESRRKDILGELDKINEEQNKVRERIVGLALSQTEMSMALENLSIEYNRQKELEQMNRKRMYVLLKVAYRIKKEGMLKFLFTGQDMGQLSNRVRVLYYTLRSHTFVTQQLKERASRLAESEKKITEAKREQQVSMDELREQETLLKKMLGQKRRLVAQINKKQNSYQVALKEYKRLSAQLNSIFSQFKTSEDEKTNIEHGKPSFTLPVEGRIVQGFGKSINHKFGTVIYHKGWEIEAQHNSPVSAVADGIVEYAGWVRGLGNVAILHHGSGLYTLNAHLFKIAKSAGSRVDQGEVIGTVGDTGANEQPSLYFEVREKGKAVDPVAYFSADRVTHLN